MDVSAVLRTTKRALKARGLTQQQVADALGMSLSGAKKMLAGPDVSLRRLAQLASLAGVALDELLSASQQEPIGRVALSDEQQRFLIEDRAAFAVFWMLVVERHTVASLRREFGLDDLALRRTLGRLDDLGLIELHADDRIRVPHAELFRWIDDGPLLEALNRRFSRELVEDSLGSQRPFRLHQLKLRAESVRELESAIQELLDNFQRRARYETLTSPEDALEWVRVIAATAAGRFVDEVPA